jgi:hypothetical protein
MKIHLSKFQNVTEIIYDVIFFIFAVLLAPVNLNICFLQEKFPHFCKNFSPGTGGEILCQPQQL